MNPRVQPYGEVDIVTRIMPDKEKWEEIGRRKKVVALNRGAPRQKPLF